MRPASIEEALSYCLDNPEGLSTEALLNRFPEYREELEPLLALDADVRVAASQEMPTDRRIAMQERLVRAAAARQPAAPAADGRVKAAEVVRVRDAGIPWWRRRLRWVSAAATTLAIALVWWLSATSLPDSLFYPVKLTTENLLLNFAGSRPAILRGHLGLANVRLGDIVTMQSRDRLGLAGPAFDNYDYHLGNCLRLWQAQDAPRDPELASQLYASSVAGQNVFAGMEQGVDTLPEQLKANFERTTEALRGLNTSTGEYLQQAGFDLDQVLQTTDADISRFLTPLPGLVKPTTTAEATPSPPAGTPSATLLPTVPPIPEPTLTAVLWSAQTAIAEGGDSSTPVIAAAETVIAGATGTPMAQAIQTVLAYTTATPNLSPTTAIATLIPSVTPAVTAGLPALTATIEAPTGPTPGVPPPTIVHTPAAPHAPTVELTATVALPPAAPQPPEVPTPGVVPPELTLP